MRNWMTAFVLGLTVAAAAQAQDEPGRAQPPRRPPLRLEVTPSTQFYRQCTDWYVIEQRAAGPTVVPQTRCRWALRR
jgi:hypothetical protein